MKRIFVSSTFRDMNIERDILSQQVMPRFNEVAEQYGESISFCDLRWGVDTAELESDEGAKKVLSVCLDEIEYGALRNAKQLQNTLFYFREIKGEPLSDYCAEDIYHKEKLDELKNRIIQMGGRVRNYTTSWDKKNNILANMDSFG